MDAVIAVLIDAAQSLPATISLGAIQHLSPLLSRNSQTWSAMLLSLEL